MSRYPQIRVALRTANPLVLVSAVRHALWRAGVPGEKIREFSSQALDETDAEGIRRVCDAWVDTGPRS